MVRSSHFVRPRHSCATQSADVLDLAQIVQLLEKHPRKKDPVF